MLKVLLSSLFAVLVLLTTLAQAQTPLELILNRDEISVDSDSLILKRTSATPSKVKIKMHVAMRDTVCLRHETRLVTRRDEFRCGSHMEQRTSNCQRVCVRTSTCPPGAINCQPRCLAFETRCAVTQVRVVNICTFPETFCAQSGVRVTGHKTDQVTIKFKDLPALGGSEEELFSLSASQARIDGSNVEFILSPIRTLENYSIKTRDFLGDVITIKR